MSQPIGDKVLLPPAYIFMDCEQGGQADGIPYLITLLLYTYYIPSKVNPSRLSLPLLFEYCASQKMRYIHISA